MGFYFFIFALILSFLSSPVLKPCHSLLKHWAWLELLHCELLMETSQTAGWITAICYSIRTNIAFVQTQCRPILYYNATWNKLNNYVNLLIHCRELL